MISCYILENNKVVPYPELDIDKITWCDVLEPSDNEIIEISQKFKINLEDLEDCLDLTERPRFNYDHLLENNLLLLRVVQSFEVELDKRATNPIGIFFTSHDKILTIHPLLARNFNDLIDVMNRQPIENAWFLVTELIHILIKQLDQVSQKIATKIIDLQNKILRAPSVREIHEPFELNSYLIFFNTSMLGNVNSIKGFFTRNRPIIEANIPLLENYDDVMTDSDQVYNFTSIYRDQFANIIDAYASVINNNLTQVMKVVGSISLILMIPTLIASIYGMNIGLPGGVTGSDRITFIVILILSFGVSYITWLFFRRAKWL
jgi:magnesium transporter